MSPTRSPADLATRLAELTSELSEPITLDRLTRDYSIFQRRRGHRHSTDDALTAWYAATHSPRGPVSTMLDLGTGIGSVGLALAWYFREATLTAIEVQAVSFRLLRENVWANGVEGRARIIHGDLRDALPDGAFDLVSASPPYFDVKAGIVSPDSQRAGARFELCGDIGDYCRAARRVLALGGRFVFCFPTVQRERAERACREASLSLLSIRDVIPREGLAPLFSLFACTGDDSSAIAMHVESPLMVRDSRGVHTPEMIDARGVFFS
jgi:tRNA1(Val) A37 N6-methylase TrmN6